MSTVAKAVSLLEHFTLGEPEIGLSDIARKAGLEPDAKTPPHPFG